jgi:EKC/KEOPS complex subunit CGI121/TPRKB
MCANNRPQIAESFRRFGISPTTSAVLVIKVTTPSSPETLTATTIQEHLSASIQGVQIDPSDENIGRFTDWARVRKVYKLPAINTTAAGKGKSAKAIRSEGQERRELEVQVLGAMALRGFLS